jgi:hypothetical protein
MSSPLQIDAIEAQILDNDIIILAAEDWAHEYSKDTKSHAQLIRGEATLMRDLRRFFRALSGDVDKFVSWSAYNEVLGQIQADEDQFSIDVIVRDVPIAESDNTFLKIVFDDLVSLAASGALSGENIYKRYIGMTSTSAEIQRFAREQAASLVGKRLDKDGNIIDNPNAEYRISDTTRNDIRESIRTSLNLGEDQATASERLRAVIRNKKRAELIAQTEAVNSFQGGLLTFGKTAGAVGKEWQSIGAKDICAEYENEGIVDIKHLYGGRIDGPSAHPRCRCSVRLVFPEELEN